MWQRVKTKSQKVLEANSEVSRSVRGKTGRERELFGLAFRIGLRLSLTLDISLRIFSYGKNYVDHVCVS